MRLSRCTAAGFGLLFGLASVEAGGQTAGAAHGVQPRSLKVETLAVALLRPPPPDSTGVPGLRLHTVAKDYFMKSAEGAEVSAELKNDRSHTARLSVWDSTFQVAIQAWTGNEWRAVVPDSGRRRLRGTGAHEPFQTSKVTGKITVEPGSSRDFVVLVPCAGFYRLVLTAATEVDTCVVVSNSFTVVGMVRD